MNKTYTVRLKAKARRELRKAVRRGKESARKLTRCRILLLADERKPDSQIAEALAVAMSTIFEIRRRYAQEGLEAALNERPRPGQPPKFDGKHRAKITALACSKVPKGRSRWTLRLLAEKAVELKMVDGICPATVQTILKKKLLKSEDWRRTQASSFNFEHRTSPTCWRSQAKSSLLFYLRGRSLGHVGVEPTTLALRVPCSTN